MLNEAAAINPPEKAEDRPSSSSSKKFATFTTGSKIHKSKIPTTQFGRNAAQADSASHPTNEESSSGISSNNNSARRPTMRTLSGPPSGRKSASAAAAEKRQLEIQYSSKKTRYANLKKTLADKQKVAQELYDEMSSLRERIISVGGKDPGKLEGPRPLQPDSSKQNPLTSVDENPRDSAEQHSLICMDESVVIGVSTLQNQLQDLCDRSQELCRSALDEITSLVSFVKGRLTELYQQDNAESAPVNSEQAQLELTVFSLTEQDYEQLKAQLERLKSTQNDFLAEFGKRCSTLRSEYESYRGRVNEPPKRISDRTDLQQQLDTALDELKVERDRVNQGRERTRMMEVQMQKMRAKIRELEGHVANEETRSQQLQNTVRSLEAQLRQKDQTMEQRMRDMHKAMKSSEGLVAKMEKQRDSFESRMVELKEKMVCKEDKANATIKELSEKFTGIDAEINEEREKRKQAESALAEMGERCKHLEEKSQLLCDLASEKSNNLTVSDDNHTQNEVCLYNDLMAARAELERQKETIEQLEKEKREIVDVMHQAAVSSHYFRKLHSYKDQEITFRFSLRGRSLSDRSILVTVMRLGVFAQILSVRPQSRDNEDETKDKLAAELVAKTNDLQNLMLEHAQLQKIARFVQERNEVLEQQLSEIQRRLHAKSKESGSKNGFDESELQQQISDLRSSLAEVIRQNQEMETALTQKRLELEQRDRVMREQSKFLKVRDDLLSLLKGKQQDSADNPTNESYEDDEISKQIAAKSEAIQELYATLEGKQMQVLRLEKLVKLLEDQQDRAQAQRTRLEHRIAQLEVSLQEKSKNGSNRYVVRKCFSPRTLRSRVADYAPSRAFSTSFCLGTAADSCGALEPSRYRTSSPSPPPRRFHVNNRYPLCSGGEEAFVCERCRGEIDGRFTDAIGHVQRDPRDSIRENLYGWLMGTAALGAFGEPTRALNRFCDRSSSSDEDTDCFVGIVNPLVDLQNCSRESRHRCERHCRRYRSRSSRRSFRGASPRQRNPIIHIK
ncbi:myosin-16 isoform X1 [Ooceraea biroi]|uniref:myosin-16 isoform X1 n=1 Tax=Ooceraea biroi TaxID=2015173 RepID=UPI000F08F242|nr:myosin-16 isoform X1 [Ooceraea biroi]